MKDRERKRLLLIGSLIVAALVGLALWMTFDR